MENVIYIRDLDDLKYFDNLKFSRIYFGVEFCEMLIPSIKELNFFLNFVSNRKIKFSLVLPYVTNHGLELCKKLFHIIPKNTEVIFNDWGLLKIIKSNNLIPVMGRLLLFVKRDPRILEFSEDLDYYQNSSLNNISFQNFLIKNNIMRVELDNVIQGYNFNLDKKISTSLYYPYVYITTSKKCMSSYLLHDDVNSCFFDCVHNNFVAKLGEDSKDIILKGNSQFYINNKKPVHFKDWNVNRFVYIPKLPFSVSL